METSSLNLMSQQPAMAKSVLLSTRNPISRLPTRIGFKKPATIQLAARSELLAADTKAPAPAAKLAPARPVQLFVGLPLDVVTDHCKVNHAKALAAGLRALKLLGVHGVELPIWWGVAQPDSPDRSDWTAYLALAAAAHDAGLHLRVALNLHSNPGVALPAWLTRFTSADPDLLFTDRSGRRHPGCLSLAADDRPVLGGATPLQAYESFLASFRSAFSGFLGSTITDVSVGLGPVGELSYPSLPAGVAWRKFAGVGEFQCYDKYILESLKAHAEAAGNPLWGLGGPHDAPEYNHAPGGFFSEHGGSWESAYGQFFLSWYSGQLIDHGDRVLSVASKVFGEMPVRISGRVPVLPNWYKTRSRAAELTAGFYNADGRDGYDAVAEVFARNSCAMILPGMELADRDQPLGLKSSPEALLAQIRRACDRHGVAVTGENSSLAGTIGFDRIKKNLSSAGPRMDSFMYQRMGAYFFSPEHWPRFAEFVRSLSLPELDDEDLLSKTEERVSMPMASSVQASDRKMQAV